MVMAGMSRSLFSIQAHCEGSTLARILDLFIVHDVLYDTLSAQKTEDGMQWVKLHCCNVEDQSADVLLNKIKQIVTVRNARVETTILRA